jgi:hypothetical protein
VKLGHVQLNLGTLATSVCYMHLQMWPVQTPWICVFCSRLPTHSLWPLELPGLSGEARLPREFCLSAEPCVFHSHPPRTQLCLEEAGWNSTQGLCFVCLYNWGVVWKINSNVKNKPVLVAHACNPSYLGGWDGEDHSSRPVQAKNLWDPHLQKVTRAKWTGDMAQGVEHLLCKCKALSSKPSPTIKEC